MQSFGQGALEYLLLVGGAVLIGTIVLVVILGATTTSNNQVNQFLSNSSNATTNAFNSASGGTGSALTSCMVLADTFTLFAPTIGINYAGDGLPEHEMDFARPTGPGVNGPFPAMILVHGGYWNSAFGGRTESYITSAAGQFLRQGFAVFAIDYELANATNAAFPENAQDVACAIRYIKENAALYQIDPARIGLYGASAGAQLAMLVASMESNEPILNPATDHISGTGCENASIDHRVQLVWSQAGPGDFDFIAQSNGATWQQCSPAVGDCVYYAQLFGSTYTNNPAPWTQASVPGYLSLDDPLTIMGQGDADTLVDYQWTQQLYNEYISAGAPAQLVLMPGADHFYYADYLFPSNKPVRCVAEPLMKNILNPGASLISSP